MLRDRFLDFFVIDKLGKEILILVYSVDEHLSVGIIELKREVFHVRLCGSAEMVVFQCILFDLIKKEPIGH